MTDIPLPLELEVLHIDRQSGAKTPVGKVQYAEEGRLALLGAETGKEEMLNNVIGAMNKKTVLHIDAAPPPDAKQFAVYSRIVQRADPNFLNALRQVLIKYYDLHLYSDLLPPEATSAPPTELPGLLS